MTTKTQTTKTQTSKAAPVQARARGAVSLAQIAALDSMTASGGFYSRGVQYHAGKGRLTVTGKGDAVTIKAATPYLANRTAPDVMAAVKKAAQRGGDVQGVKFIKAPKGAPTAYAIERPSEGGKISQAFFASLFTA